MILMPLLLPLTRQPSAAFLLYRYFTKNRDKTTDKAVKILFLYVLHKVHIYAVLKIAESLIWWAFVHFVQYMQYIFTRMEKKNKKAGRVEGNTPIYNARTRARKNAAHTAQSAQSPAQRGFAGRGKSAFLCSCAVFSSLSDFAGLVLPAGI